MNKKFLLLALVFFMIVGQTENVFAKGDPTTVVVETKVVESPEEVTVTVHPEKTMAPSAEILPAENTLQVKDNLSVNQVAESESTDKVVNSQLGSSEGCCHAEVPSEVVLTLEAVDEEAERAYIAFLSQVYNPNANLDGYLLHIEAADFRVLRNGNIITLVDPVTKRRVFFVITECLVGGFVRVDPLVTATVNGQVVDSLNIPQAHSFWTVSSPNEVRVNISIAFPDGVTIGISWTGICEACVNTSNPETPTTTTTVSKSVKDQDEKTTETVSLQCINEVIINEYREDLVAEYEMWAFSKGTVSKVPVALFNITANLSDSYRNGTIHETNCLWAGDNLQKSWVEIRDFGGALVAILPLGSRHPEFPLTGNYNLILWNDGSGKIMESGLDGSNSKWVANGDWAHTRPSKTDASKYDLIYTNPKGYVEYRSADGKVSSSKVRAYRCHLHPVEEFALCLSGDEYIKVDLATMTAQTLQDGKVLTATFDPSHPDTLVASNYEGFYVSDDVTDPMSVMIQKLNGNAPDISEDASK
jgi:hypothetical protein